MDDQRRQTFHPPPFRLEWFSNEICRVLPSPAGAVAVLDIGCGTGDQIFDLAARMPAASFVGVDISSHNVEIAEERRRSHPAGARIAFAASDYLELRAGRRFDVIVSYSALHLVEGATARLAARIGEDAAPQATVVNVMPYHCAYNRSLLAVRRTLRAARSPATDAMVFAAGRLVHGRTYGPMLLQERVASAYLIPVRFEQELAGALAQHGFETVVRRRSPHASPAQMKHVIHVMRRR